ncbi:hypothetical protein [Comamonas sp.]|uniref:hypothetical protein n=1 Tax=Comamonas sp. TaxID=34028 RepID=UPI003A8CC945
MNAKAKDQRSVANPDEVKVNLAHKSSASAPGNQAQLPHERDQSLHATGNRVHPEMQQAHQDLKKGLVDTDARAKDGRPLGSRRRTE